MKPRLALTAAGAPQQSHDLRSTSMWSLLRQRFMGAALEAAVVRTSSGWTDLETRQSEEALAILLKGWAVSSSDGAGTRAWLATRSASTLWVSMESDGSWEAGASGETNEDVVATLSAVAAAFPRPELEGTGTVPVRFWAWAGNYAMSYVRRPEVPGWAEIECNYPYFAGDGSESTRGELDKLMALREPDEGSGRLLLLHGPAGTGKTFTIRALADAWRAWCDVDYIVDADEFFGRAAYMVQALLEADSDRWRLVIIEDSGEFLLAKKVSQGLSRLLNLADGMVGQGLKLLVMMTTNEPVEELYPAVTRPGRCLASIRLGPFEAEEASAWLEAHGAPPASEPMTLAQMFAKLGG